MNTPRRITAFVLSLMVVTSLHAAKAQGQKAPPLTSRVLAVLDETGAPASGPIILSDAARSGSDSYVTSKTAGTVSEFQGGTGDWHVESGSGSRAFWLDLGPGTLFPGQYVSATIYTYCSNNGLRTVGSLRGVGDTTTCPMLFRIGGPENPEFYRLAFNSYKRPGAENVTFTCEAVKSATDATCVRWSGRPADVDLDGRSRGQLLHVQSATRKTPEQETYVGEYDVIFEFSITR